MPSNLDDASTYSAERLSQTCADRQDDGSHEPFCVELFRRAVSRLADSDVCWVNILDVYTRQVKAWIRQKLFGKSQDEIDDLARDTFARFSRYYTAEKFEAANHGISSIMSFLRTCAFSIAVDELRKLDRQPEDNLPEEDMEGMSDDVLGGNHQQPVMAPRSTPDFEIERRLWLEQCWKRVDELVRNDKERIVAQLSLSEELKPRQIYALHPLLFKDIAQVSEIKRIVFERLERDAILQDLHKNRPGAR